MRDEPSVIPSASGLRLEPANLPVSGVHLARVRLGDGGGWSDTANLTVARLWRADDRALVSAFAVVLAGRLHGTAAVMVEEVGRAGVRTQLHLFGAAPLTLQTEQAEERILGTDLMYADLAMLYVARPNNPTGAPTYRTIGSGFTKQQRCLFQGWQPATVITVHDRTGRVRRAEWIREADDVLFRRVEFKNVVALNGTRTVTRVIATDLEAGYATDLTLTHWSHNSIGVAWLCDGPSGVPDLFQHVTDTVRDADLSTLDTVQNAAAPHRTQGGPYAS